MSRSAFSEVELARSPCSGDVPSDMKSQSRVIPACFRTIRTLAGASAQFFRSGRARTGMRTATDVEYSFLLHFFCWPSVRLLRMNDCPKVQVSRLLRFISACYPACVWLANYPVRESRLPWRRNRAYARCLEGYVRSGCAPLGKNSAADCGLRFSDCEFALVRQARVGPAQPV